MNKAIIICGPTASGKTDFAHKLALKNNGEIVNADDLLIELLQIPAAHDADFKYKSVWAHDFGLTDEDIMLLDDTALQEIVGIKKYSTYWDDEDNVNVYGVINKKWKFKDDLKKSRWQLEEELKLNMKLHKEKLLNTGADTWEIKKELKRRRKAAKYAN